MRSRIVATCIVLGLLAVACGNATSSKATNTTIPGGTATTVANADLQKHVPISGVNGVTDDSINVAAITSNVQRQSAAGVLIQAPEGGLTVDSVSGSSTFNSVVLPSPE